MKKTISFFSKGKALGFVALTAMMFLLSVNNSTAQQSAAGNLNPYTHIATKLDVTAYPLGTFERTHTMEVLEQILAGLKPLLSNGGGSQSQRLKYDYANRMLADINNQFIGVELTLLTSLSALISTNSGVGVQNADLRALYNEIVNQID